MNLLHLFDLSLIARRDQIALEWEGAQFAFGEIENRSNRVAHALRARGLAKGDRLAVYLANRIELIDLYLACVKLGVIFVPINVLYRDREIAHITGDAEPRFVIREEDLPRLMSDAERASSERPDEDLDGDSPAAIIYTSGTTGASKGAVLTHNNFAANAVNLLTMWQISDRDRFLLALPLFHIHALGNGLHCWLASGCRMRLLERFDHRRALDEFDEFQPTLFFGVPTIYIRLLDMPPDAAREIGARMRLFVSGSAPLPANVFDRFRELFGHAILERYGMTETFMTLSNPYIGERRAGTVGFPLPAFPCASMTASCSCVDRMSLPATGGVRTPPPRPSPKAGSAPAIWRHVPTTVTTRCSAASPISSSPAASTSIPVRSKSYCSNNRAWPRPRSSECRTNCAEKSRSRSSSLRPSPNSMSMPSSATAASSLHRSKSRANSYASIRSPAPPSAKCRNISCDKECERLARGQRGVPAPVV